MSQPIMDLLEGATKQALNTQFEHLTRQGEQPHFTDTERTRFKAMADGARTVLNILDTTSLGGQGTTAFLRQLNREQLHYAIEQAQHLLKERTDQGKVKLFAVYTSHEDQWHTDKTCAQLAFVASAQSEIAASRHAPKVEFDTVLVPVEDLATYLGEKQANAFLADHPERIIKPTI